MAAERGRAHREATETVAPVAAPVAAGATATPHCRIDLESFNDSLDALFRRVEANMVALGRARASNK